MLRKTYNNFYTFNLWLNYINKKNNNLIRLNLISLCKVSKKLNLNLWKCNIITISGTNGKGSLISCISKISKFYKINLGEYTSPHILDFKERIKYNRKHVGNTCFYSTYESVSKKTKYHYKSFFDFITISSLIYLKKKHNIDIMILESGLGGRLDSTNIIDCGKKYKKIGIVTSISLDHGEYLGYSLKKILYEKLGIMKKRMLGIIGINNIPNIFCYFLKKKKCRVFYLQNKI